MCRSGLVQPCWRSLTPSLPCSLSNTTPPIGDVQSTQAVANTLASKEAELVTAKARPNARVVFGRMCRVMLEQLLTFMRFSAFLTSDLALYGDLAFLTTQPRRRPPP
jgi:hypothetical protein